MRTWLPGGTIVPACRAGDSADHSPDACGLTDRPRVLAFAPAALDLPLLAIEFIGAAAFHSANTRAKLSRDAVRQRERIEAEI